MVFVIHRGEPMNNHVRKEKLGLTAISVASISGTLAARSVDASGKYLVPGFDETTRAPRESLAQQFTDTVPASAAATFHRCYEFQRKVAALMREAGYFNRR